MELQEPQHLHEFDQHEVVQFTHLIWQLHGYTRMKKNSHGSAYVNPLLI